MVPPMSLEKASPSLGLRLAVTAAYLLLAVTFQPLLLEHTLASPTDLHHSETDLCSWLDHVAGVFLQAGPVSLPLMAQVAVIEPSLSSSIHPPSRQVELSRGPPSAKSSLPF